MNEQLLDAYKSTRYTVDDLNLTVKIGNSTPALDHLLAQKGLTEWAYITAYNPYSRLLSEEANLSRLRELKQMVSGYCYYEGSGIGEEPSWQPERSLLILGISREEARRLGRYFEQNAIVVGTANRPAELLLLV